MSPEALAACAGGFLSLLFNYVPGLNARFDRLTADGQRALMALLLAVTAAGMALWTCTSPDTAETFGLCVGATNWRAVATNFVFALIANQGVDRLSPKPRAEETKNVVVPLVRDLK